MPGDERPHVVLVNWRDTANPAGGGSELYVERIARGLVGRGYRVTIQCPRHSRAPDDEDAGGVRFRRRGNRVTVYLHALLAVMVLRPDVVVDVQNGLPFLSPLVARGPVVVLVHHLHREQWYVYLGGFLGAVGWWVESRFAPWWYRNCCYVTVSEATASELSRLGVSRSRVTLVPCGQDAVPAVGAERSDGPSLIAVSRLVPHKRLEDAIEAVARLECEWPDLRLDIVGYGHSAEKLSAYARRRGVERKVGLRGRVSELRKHELLARSWVHLCPSLKEGWGLVITEAAAHGVPSVAYRSAGGVSEAIVDGESGLLVNDVDEFVRQVARLLGDPGLRQELGARARQHASELSWDNSVDIFEGVLDEQLRSGAERVQQPVE